MKKLFLLLALTISANSYSKCYTTYAQTIWNPETNTWKEWVNVHIPFCIDENSNDITIYSSKGIINFYCYKLEEQEKSEQYPFNIIFYCVTEHQDNVIIQLRKYNINDNTGWQLLLFDNNFITMYAVEIE